MKLIFLRMTIVLSMASCGGLIASTTGDDGENGPGETGGDAAYLFDDGGATRDGDLSSRNTDAANGLSFDADALDVATDSPAIAPCLAAADVIFVQADSDADGIDGPESVTSATGNWTASLLTGSLLAVNVTLPSSDWRLQLLN